MLRRSFLKTTAAGLLVPTLFHPRTASPPKFDLSLFCDGDFTRYDLSRPFTQEEWTYATDARICIRTQLVTQLDVESQGRVPRGDSLGWDDGKNWRPWRTRRIPSLGDCYTCPTCDGKGRQGNCTACPRCCDGFVEIDYDDAVCGHGSYEEGCKHCNALGWIGGTECETCNGAGDVDFCYRLGHVHIAPAYESKIMTLQDVEFADDRSRDPESGIPFRFDGGQGLLMPLARN